MRSQRNLHNKHLKSFRLAKMSPKVRRGHTILSVKLQRNHHNRNLKRTDILSLTHHLLASTSVAYCSPLQEFHQYRSAVCSFFCCVIWFQCAKISHPWFRCLPVLQNFSVKKETARCWKHWNLQRSKRFDSSHSSSLGYYCRPLTPTTVLHQLGFWICSWFLPKQISRNSKKTSRQKRLQYLVNLPHSSREPCDPWRHRSFLV